MVRYFGEFFNEELSKGEQPLAELTVAEPNFEKFQETSGTFKQQNFWYQPTEFRWSIRHKKWEAKQTLYTFILFVWMFEKKPRIYLFYMVAIYPVLKKKERK